MILQLNPESFRDFGTILPESRSGQIHTNRHSIPLTKDTTATYRTAADTLLLCERRSCIRFTRCGIRADGLRLGGDRR